MSTHTRKQVVDQDLSSLTKAEANYGNSWKKRGGVGAFMMLARKWDRLENRLVAAPNFQQYDIFQAIVNDTRPEGIIDDIRDLRRYLILLEAEMLERGSCPGLVAKDMDDGVGSIGSKEAMLDEQIDHPHR